MVLALYWAQDLNRRTRQREYNGTLVCTVGDGFDPDVISFQDGLCTFIFFDSLYKPGGSTLSRPFKKNFQYFLEKAVGSEKTEYGIGIDYAMRKDTSFATEPATKKQLDELWKSRIHHYGHINTPAFGVKESDIAELIHSIRAIAALMKHKQDLKNKPISTAVLLPIVNERVAKFIVKTMRNAPVSILIGVAHQVGEDKMNPNCLMMPPSFLDSPSTDYPYSLRLWHKVFKIISEAGLPTILALSVGIAIRRYRPRYPDPYVKGDDRPGNYSLTHQCTAFKEPQLLNALQICEGPENNYFWQRVLYDNATKSEFWFNKTERWLYTHDGVEGLQAKLCEAKKEYTSFSYVLAPMGIEYADLQFRCHHKSYQKVSFLSSLAGFFEEEYTSPDAFEECLLLGNFITCC